MNIRYIPKEIIDSKYHYKTVLKYIPQEYIWSLVVGYAPEEGKMYCSPFREDNNPKCFYSYANGYLKFSDFAAGHFFTCFDAAKRLLKIGFNDFLRHLVDSYDFLSENKYCSIHQNTQKASSQIFVERRDFYNRDGEFWEPYEISKSQLEEAEVFPVKSFIVRRGVESKEIPSKLHSYAYCEFKYGRKKIYQPYAKKGKWYTNTNKNDIGGLKHLKRNSILIITKSLKDWAVVKNTGYDSVWFQNEGMFPDENFLLFLRHRKEIVVFFDNDDPGRIASLKILNSLKGVPFLKNKKIHSIELERGKYKDASDFVKGESSNKLRTFLTNR